MSKKRQAGVAPQPIAAPAQTTNPTALSLASPLKIQFDSDSQLRITVVTPEKPPAPLNRWMRSLILGVFLIALLWFFLSARYLALRFPPPAEFNDASLSIALAHPAYLAYGDEAEMELTVANIGGQSFTGSVTVNFPGGVPVRPLASETTTIKIEKLSPNACVTSRLKFALRQQTRLFKGNIRLLARRDADGTRIHARLRRIAHAGADDARVLEPVLPERPDRAHRLSERFRRAAVDHRSDRPIPAQLR
jgi:hypothetical protein